jgi:PAS domain S-box-containing protein
MLREQRRPRAVSENWQGAQAQMSLANHFKSNPLTVDHALFRQVALGVGALALAWVLAIDALTPLGLLVPLLYILIVGFGAWLPRKSNVIVVAIVSTIFTIGGVYLSPPGHEYWMDILNRVACVLVIWGIVLMDISRRNAVAALEKSKEKFRILTELMPQMVLTATRSGKVDFVNQSWSRFTGKDLDYALDSGWLDVIAVDDLPFVLETWRNCLATGHPARVECRVKRFTDKSFRWHLLVIAPLDGIERWLITATDVEELMQPPVANAEHLRLVPNVAGND